MFVKLLLINLIANDLYIYVLTVLSYVRQQIKAEKTK